MSLLNDCLGEFKQKWRRSKRLQLGIAALVQWYLFVLSNFCIRAYHATVTVDVQSAKLGRSLALNGRGILRARLPGQNGNVVRHKYKWLGLVQHDVDRA